MKRILIILLVLTGLSFSQDQFPEFPIFPDFSYMPETEETAVYTYQAESLALFARMTTEPDETRRLLIDGLIADLKTAGLWSGFDASWMFAAHDSQAALLNWKEDNNNCNEVNNPVFTTNLGYTGGSSAYLNTNFNPSINGENFTLDEGVIGIFSNTIGQDTGYEIGGSSVFNKRTAIRIRTDDNEWVFHHNSNLGFSEETIIDGSGLRCVDRKGEDDVSLYAGGELFDEVVLPNQGITDVNLYILCLNNNGTPSNFSSRTIRFAFISRSLTDNEQSTLFNLIETYLDAIGAGVVE